VLICVILSKYQQTTHEENVTSHTTFSFVAIEKSHENFEILKPNSICKCFILHCWYDM